MFGNGSKDSFVGLISKLKIKIKIIVSIFKY